MPLGHSVEDINGNSGCLTQPTSIHPEACKCQNFLFPSSNLTLKRDHSPSLASIGFQIVETYFWHYCGVTHTICFFSLHQTLSYLYTSGSIEDTSLHFLHSSFIVIVIVRSTYLSRSQMVDSQGCSPFSLR